jgi:hypothetical protein
MNGLRSTSRQHETNGFQSVGPRLAVNFIYPCDEVRWHALECVLKALEVLLDFVSRRVSSYVIHRVLLCLKGRVAFHDSSSS